MANVFDPEWDEEREDGPFRWRRARIGRQSGSLRLGASVFELPPGGATFPLHAHFANEELLVVLAGAPTLSTADGRRVLAPGEAVAFRAGRGGAHRIDNHGGDPVRLLIVSTMLAPEINAMLEDGTYWIRDYPPGGDGEGADLDLRLPPQDA